MFYNKENERLQRIINWLIKLLNQSDISEENVKNFLIYNQIPDESITVEPDKSDNKPRINNK